MPRSAAAGTAMPAAAQACDAGGRWSAIRSNGASVDLDLVQHGRSLDGTAYEPDIGNGTVRGSLRGKEIVFDIRWANGGVGAYSGRVGGNGHIRHGFTYDRRSPDSRASWYNTPALDCGD
ncbi:hypothetical protein [Inquilinus limosus]|uniref:Uncharacterized protein n=1 Tax=Inquilinus limosus MP06 TaxID=1398085 RepID=A0A0A0DB01_9PROT|nr:hypothetical protein [Inquilinus limosus]KGM34167.1 hypothetical protein P409_11710 [Inquilinus limosus MP06]